MNTNDPSYQQFVVLVQSKPFQPRTRTDYLRLVRRLGKHYPNKPLAQITEIQVFDYLIHRREVEKARPSTLNQSLVALRFFYRDCLGRDWQLWKQFEIRYDYPLPVVLTQSEACRLFANIKEGRFKAPMALMYHCGLRMSEAIALRPKDIDSERCVVRVRNGKGGKMRDVPISKEMIDRMRNFWLQHRNPYWLFPTQGRGWKKERRTHREAMATATKHMTPSSLQNVMRMLRVSAGIKKEATCHSLRHSFATHLLESGVSILQVSQYLGHSSIRSTLIYLHVTEVSEAKGREVQSDLFTKIIGSK